MGSDGSCFYMLYFHVKMAPKMPFEPLPGCKNWLPMIYVEFRYHNKPKSICLGVFK